MKPEQASKVTIRMPTLLPFGEGRVSGEASIPAPARSAGVVGTARWKGGSGNRQRSGPFRESCTVRRSLPSASTYYDKIHPRTSCDTPLARANAGAPGRDGMTFARIEASVAGGPARGTGFEDVPARSLCRIRARGVGILLGSLNQELTSFLRSSEKEKGDA